MRELGRGNFGVTMLMQDLQTNEYVAAKFIQRGAKVSSGASVPAAGCNHVWDRSSHQGIDRRPTDVQLCCRST